VRVGLLADIHGNADALRAVSAAMRGAGVDQLLVAGDLVGYYYEPGAALALLNEWPWSMVRGNHEDMLSRAIDGDDVDRMCASHGSALRHTMRDLSQPQLQDLTSRPDTVEIVLDGHRVLVCHGSPWKPDEYVYPDAPDRVRERMLVGGQGLVVFGHTHHPVAWSFGNRRAVNPGGRPAARSQAWRLLGFVGYRERANRPSSGGL
jgi:predicted phosphodiesterase